MNADFSAPSSRRGGKAGLRNTASLIDTAAPHFEAAHYQGVLAIYAHPSWGRTIRLNYDGRTIVDFVRCSSVDLFRPSFSRQDWRKLKTCFRRPMIAMGKANRCRFPGIEGCGS